VPRYRSYLQLEGASPADVSAQISGLGWEMIARPVPSTPDVIAIERNFSDDAKAGGAFIDLVKEVGAVAPAELETLPSREFEKLLTDTDVSSRIMFLADSNTGDAVQDLTKDGFILSHYQVPPGAPEEKPTRVVTVQHAPAAEAPSKGAIEGLDTKALWDALDAEERNALARDLLHSRLALRKHEAARAAQEVELARAGVKAANLHTTMTQERNAEALKLVAERRKQVQKWTQLALPGLIALAVTTVFGMAATAWLILLAGRGKISSWSLPAAIFVLALFAASPAVLLLRERPLKGIDEWKPGAGSAPKSKS
jgi:hypothetical protein